MTATKGVIREFIECVAMALVLAILIITFVVQSFVVDGSSMEPTLHDGQRLLVNKLLYRFSPPRAGDIVVFRYPSNPKEDFIKRVVATQWDIVEIRDGKVFVNGVALDEPFLAEDTLGEFGPLELPQGKFFVLGDNRNNSRDSRYPDVGLLERKHIVGKAAVVYWPLGDFGLIGGTKGN